MKKIFISLLIGLLNVLVSTAATVVEIDGIEYNIATSNTASVNKVKKGGDVIIPSSIEHENVNYSVTSILNNTFSASYDVKSITIPASVTKLDVGIANGLILDYLKFLGSDDENDAKLSFTSTNTQTQYCFLNCTIKKIYIGRNIEINSKYYFLNSTCKIGTIEVADNIHIFPDYFFNLASIIEENNNIIEIPEGIEILGKYSLFLKDLEYIILPSTLKEISGTLTTRLKNESGDIASLEMRALEPMRYPSSLRPFDGFKFEKLYVPKDCKQAYINAGWGEVVNELDDIVALDKEPEESEEPGDPATTHMIRLMLPSSGEGNCYPKFEVESGADFSILFEVEQGWKISSAVYMPEETAQYPDSPRYAGETSSANIQIEPTSDPNHYRLTVSEISGSGTLTYVLEKEIATESQRLYTEDESPRLSISGGILSILTHQDSQVRVYDIRGNEVFAQPARKDSPLSVSSLPSGVYVVRVGRSHTYKIAL